MFDPLLEEDPWIKEKVAQGILQGEARGIMKSSRTILVKVVRSRFPSLGDVAEIAAAQIADFEVLEALIEQMVQATSEPQARQALERLCRIREG